MSAHTETLNTILTALSSIAGHYDAQALLKRMRTGVAPPEALLAELLEVQASGDRARLSGFVREIAKVLERTT